MKRPLTIAATAVLAMLILYACASTIRTAKTSFVTVTIGGPANTAVLKAEAATPWTRFQYFLADVKLMPEAYAYIPSIVQAIIVTVTAADITTPIVGVASVKDTDTTVSIRIEVPNGTARKFTVEGIRGLDSKTYYRGIATEDLNGADVSLPVSMNFVGPGILVDTNSTFAADVTSCGTSTLLPCKSIYYALTSRATASDAVVVSPGTYLPGFAAAPASYPLKPGTALICTGRDFSTKIDYSSAGGIPAIAGAEGASIDNCRIIVGLNGVGVIDDITGGQVPTKIKVNGSQIEMQGNVTGGLMIGIDLYSDSIVLETTVTGTGTGAFGSVIGLQVSGAGKPKPNIIGSTFANLPAGIELRATAGDVTISNSFLTGNTAVGLESVSTGKPTISNTTFDGNTTGMILGAGNPTITGCTFINNSNAGLNIISGSPLITQSVITKNQDGILGGTGTTVIQNNSIYCNTFFNISTSITATMDVRFNSWEHSPPQVNGVGVGTNCRTGDDICTNGSAVPIYQPYNAPIVCSRLTAS